MGRNRALSPFCWPLIDEVVFLGCTRGSMSQSCWVNRQMPLIHQTFLPKIYKLGKRQRQEGQNSPLASQFLSPISWLPSISIYHGNQSQLDTSQGFDFSTLCLIANACLALQEDKSFVLKPTHHQDEVRELSNCDHWCSWSDPVATLLSMFVSDSSTTHNVVNLRLFECWHRLLPSILPSKRSQSAWSKVCSSSTRRLCLLHQCGQVLQRNTKSLLCSILLGLSPLVSTLDRRSPLEVLARS